MFKKNKVVVIVGPTASGKTSLSIELAKMFNGEIISADSMQVYKGIEIASAAPTKDEKYGVEHHLISFLEPNEQYSVCDFVNDANKKIVDIIKRDRVPIIVGGTGLYIDSLLQNIDFGEETKSKIRDELNEKAENFGLDVLYNELKSLDIDAYNRIKPNDKKRIIRALEVYYSTGETITSRNERSKNNESNIDPIIFGINYSDRNELYERINKRVELMALNGLVDEAKNAYLNPKFKGAKFAIGHKELFAYFKNELSLEQALENLKMQTRRYAKRQITWFKRNENIIWLDPKDENFVLKAKIEIEEFLRKE